MLVGLKQVALKRRIGPGLWNISKSCPIDHMQHCVLDLFKEEKWKWFVRLFYWIVFKSSLLWQVVPSLTRIVCLCQGILKTLVCVPIHCQWTPPWFTAGSRVHGKDNIAFFAGLSGKQFFWFAKCIYGSLSFLKIIAAAVLCWNEHATWICA